MGSSSQLSEPCNPEHRTDKDTEHWCGCREHRKKDIACNHPYFYWDICAVEVKASDCPKRSRPSGHRRFIPSGPHDSITSGIQRNWFSELWHRQGQAHRKQPIAEHTWTIHYLIFFRILCSHLPSWSGWAKILLKTSKKPRISVYLSFLQFLFIEKHAEQAAAGTPPITWLDMNRDV